MFKYNDSFCNDNSNIYSDLNELITDFSFYATHIIGKNVKNDEELIQLLIATGLSAYSHNPINIGIEAPPGEGKTYTAVETLEIFPESDKIYLGDLSPKALVHERGIRVNDKLEPVGHIIEELEQKLIDLEDKNEKTRLKRQINKIKWESNYLIDLSNQILLFLESPNIDTWGMLRPILSHDIWITTFKITQQEAGKHVTKTVYLQGWPAVIYTKAELERDEIWNQIKSRFIIVSPNMSPAKYQAGIEVSSQRQMIPKSLESLKQSNDSYKNCKQHIIELKNELKHLLFPYKDLMKNDHTGMIKDITIFWCPFHKQLEKIFPNENGQNMRDYNTFISLMQMSALINLPKKPFIKGNDGKTNYIVLTLEDYYFAKNIFNRGTVKLKTGQQLINFYKTVLMPLWNEKNDFEDEGLLVKEIGEYCRKNYRDLKDHSIRENYLKPLKEMGFINESEHPSRSGGNKWKPLRDNLDSFIQDEIKFLFNDYKKAKEHLELNLIIESICTLNINHPSNDNEFNNSLKTSNISKAFFNNKNNYVEEINDAQLYNLIITMSQKNLSSEQHKEEIAEGLVS